MSLLLTYGWKILTWLIKFMPLHRLNIIKGDTSFIYFIRYINIFHLLDNDKKLLKTFRSAVKILKQE